jgi:hypothetical protein
MSDFSNGLDALLGLTWCIGQDRGFEEHRVERALTQTVLAKITGFAIEDMGPEKAAAFICSIVNERLKAE